jgi:hypothetical protein
MEEAGVQRWGDTLSTRLFPSHSVPGPFRLDTAPVVFRSSWNTPQACILAPNGLAFPQLTRRRWHKSGTLLVCFSDVPATIQIFAAPIFYYYSQLVGQSPPYFSTIPYSTYVDMECGKKYVVLADVLLIWGKFKFKNFRRIFSIIM